MKLKGIQGTLVAAVLLTAVQGTHAESPYIGILGTYADADDSRGVRNGHGGRLFLGVPFADRWSLELQASYLNFETGVDAGTDFYRAAGTVDVAWFARPERFTSFASVGVGAADNNVYPNSRDGVDLTANAALGLMSQPLNR